MTPRRQNVLVVDDDESARQYLSSLLTQRGYGVECQSSGDGALRRLRSSTRPAVMFLDLLMSGIDGLEVLSQMQRLELRVPTIVVTAVGQIRTVVQAMRLGAADYLVKPFEDHELELALGAVAGELAPVQCTNSGRAPRTVPRDFDLVSSNPEILRIKNIALRVAETDVPVLILGESGAGKEVLARFIHQHSAQKDGPFVKVNCAALPVELLESELFGYERGAFTGAAREKPGKFEIASGGTILLDEIGEMHLHLQAKLLHVLQDGECTRLGGTQTVRVTARVLASTNRHLDEAVARGQFREDLYYRLNVVKLKMPSLRDRREDIPLLCRQFLEEYRAKYDRGDLELPAELMEGFQKFSWPGNVRQLENTIKRYVILPDLDLAMAELTETPRPAAPPNAAEALTEEMSLKAVSAKAAEEAERDLIFRTLDEVNWNRKQAAKRLNICYKSLLNKLHRWQASNPARS